MVLRTKPKRTHEEILAERVSKADKEQRDAFYAPLNGSVHARQLSKPTADVHGRVLALWTHYVHASGDPTASQRLQIKPGMDAPSEGEWCTSISKWTTGATTAADIKGFAREESVETRGCPLLTKTSESCVGAIDTVVSQNACASTLDQIDGGHIQSGHPKDQTVRGVDSAKRPGPIEIDVPGRKKLRRDPSTAVGFLFV